MFSRYSALLHRWGRHLALVHRNNNSNNNSEIWSPVLCVRYADIIGRKYSTVQPEYSGKKIEPFARIEEVADGTNHDLPTLTSSSILHQRNSKDIYDSLESLTDVEEKRLGPLDICTEDLSHIGPSFPATFNFAAYADKSETIRRLFELGVDFSRIEKSNGFAKFLMGLDFERDMKLHIRFLNDCGVLPEQLGKFLTKNPLIFKEDLDSLHTRIRYLGAHKFSPAMIARIVTKNPFWIMFSTKRIDTRLGHFQREFQLSGKEVRTLATKQPRLITFRMNHVLGNTFAVREEMGFNKEETKLILLHKPRIWMRSRPHIVECFDYAHNVMGLSHNQICTEPEILTCRLHRLKQRHMFLVMQGRAQYDSKKPMYVSLKTLISNSDSEFSIDVAKAPVETFNMFLKTL